MHSCRRQRLAPRQGTTQTKPGREAEYRSLTVGGLSHGDPWRLLGLSIFVLLGSAPISVMTPRHSFALLTTHYLTIKSVAIDVESRNGNVE